MTDIARAKAEASRLWLARPEIQAIGAEPDGQGGWKLVVYVLPGPASGPDLPPSLHGFPVQRVTLDAPIAPLDQ